MSFSFDDAEDLKLLEGKEGTERIDVLNQLAEDYIDEAPNKTLTYGSEALQLAADLDLKEKIVESYNLVGYGFFKLLRYEEAYNSFQEAFNLSLEIEYTKGVATSRNGYGLVALAMNDNKSARNYFEEAHEKYVELDDTYWIAITKNNLGSAHEALGFYDKAIEYYIDAIKLFESIDEKEEIGNTSVNIGNVNSIMGNQELAFEFFTRAMTTFEEIENELGLALTYNNFGDFLKEYELYEQAYDAYLKALGIYSEYEKFNEVSEVFNNIAYIMEVNEDYVNAASFYEKALEISVENDNKENSIVFYNNLGTLNNRLGDYETAIEQHGQAFEMAREITSKEGLKFSLRNLALDYESLEDYENAYYYFSLYNELNDALYEEEQYTNFNNTQVSFRVEEKDNEIIVHKEEIEDRKRAQLIQLIVIAVAVIVLIVVSAMGVVIAKERKKSDKLLLNTLPKKVVEDLKKTGKTIPESFDNISIYFSDIVSFTKTSANLDPKYLINELSEMFTIFDDIMEKHGCERIKTIGDAYMAVAGMPSPDANHAYNMVSAAQDILVALKARNSNNKIEWRIRIGIHSGKATGGVVGVKKYIYDVFGDAVNTSSRMESNGAPMRINVSPSTHAILKDTFIFEEREPIEVKGKGQLIMFFLAEDQNPGEEDDLVTVEAGDESE